MNNMLMLLFPLSCTGTNSVCARMNYCHVLLVLVDVRLSLFGIVYCIESVDKVDEMFDHNYPISINNYLPQAQAHTKCLLAVLVCWEEVVSSPSFFTKGGSSFYQSD